MSPTTFAPPAYLDDRLQHGLETGALRTLEGTLQRVNYARREFSVIAQGQVWYFALARDCQLWFDDEPAILRCFHPLDQVKVIFEPTEDRGGAVKALAAWERK